MTEGPFTNEFVKHMIVSAQTQEGIIKYAEAMAQVLAEAGRASEKATGDSAHYAVNKWADIIRTRAIELLESDPKTSQQAKIKRLMGGA